eukprot:6781473-Pyramimonas_sp.AAC.1
MVATARQMAAQPRRQARGAPQANIAIHPSRAEAAPRGFRPPGVALNAPARAACARAAAGAPARAPGRAPAGATRDCACNSGEGMAPCASGSCGIV